MTKVLLSLLITITALACSSGTGGSAGSGGAGGSGGASCVPGDSCDEAGKTACDRSFACRPFTVGTHCDVDADCAPVECSEVACLQVKCFAFPAPDGALCAGGASTCAAGVCAP